VIGNVVQYEEAEIDKPVFFSFHFYMYSPDGHRLGDLINILASFFCHLHKVQHFRNWFPSEIDAGSSM